MQKYPERWVLFQADADFSPSPFVLDLDFEVLHKARAVYTITSAKTLAFFTLYSTKIGDSQKEVEVLTIIQKASLDGQGWIWTKLVIERQSQKKIVLLKDALRNTQYPTLHYEFFEHDRNADSAFCKENREIFMKSIKRLNLIKRYLKYVSK